MTYADPPLDSSEARERRELETAARDAEQLHQQQHAEICRGGWLGEDAEGRPIACPHCRPHVRNIDCHTCGQSRNACHLKRCSRLGPCCEHCDHRSRHRTTIEGKRP